MTEEQVTKARHYAACDIAHRWFAFFEGATEDVSQHSAIFADDVMLVHAGTHLLAKGKDGMAQWLRSLPYEKGSHFIRSIDVIPLLENRAAVNMDISYQMVGSDMRVGGALSEYKTTVTFDEQHNAKFAFIQKTPRFPNPDKVFRDSFAENRLRSFIARFFQLMLTNNAADIAALISTDADPDTAQRLAVLLKNSDVGTMSVLNMDADTLSCGLLISSGERQQKLDLVLQEAPGRYITIQQAKLA